MGGFSNRGLLTLSAAGLLVVAAGLAWSPVNASAFEPPAEGSNGGPRSQAGLEDLKKLIGGGGPGGPGEKQEDFKPFAEISKDFEKVVSTADGSASLYTIWTRAKDNQMIAELPRGFESQKHFFAVTVASGELFAGLQGAETYCYWKRQNNRMLLIEPELGTRATGDQEGKASVKRLFTDRVVLDLPILAIGPSGQPVIDMRELLTVRAGAIGGPGRGSNLALASIARAKSFPENVEIAWEMPNASGRLQKVHYSISVLREDPSYKPRVADERVGFFTTVYRDLGKYNQKDKWVRYVNRWHVEKRDASLKMSPPKEPIIFYVENTTPVRYRHWLREGVLKWNKAFEKIGIRDAVEVYYQDAESGAHMDKDPEDVRFNFLRWLNNDIGTAIGPSRVNPMTGQILDADIVLTDGWIRHFWTQYNEILPDIATEGFGAETLSWLENHPNWDPRVRLAPPEKRNQIIAERARRGVQAYGGLGLAAAAEGDPKVIGDREFSGLLGRISQTNGLCMAGRGKSMDMGLFLMNLEVNDLLGDSSYLESSQPDDKKDDKKDDKPGEKKDDKKDEKKESKTEMLDGVPEWFVGPLLADLVSHEAGHTLGLRHNFKASSIYTLAKINSEEVKGKVPQTGSVMDYNPVNINMNEGKLQGDFTMIDIGAYDLWAIEYGYTLDDPKKTLARVAEPELAYLTDEDVGGGDPLARRYDFSANPLDYSKSLVKLANYHRDRLVEKFVKDGESWSKLRRGYQATLGSQLNAVSIMAGWVGGVHINRGRKGDPNGTDPIQMIPAVQQRDALKFVIDNSFKDEAFGLKADLLAKMTVDKWADNGGMGELFQDAPFPIHDRIMGMQASALTMLMNPTTLRRVFDNELRVDGGVDMITLPEVMDTISTSIWGEIEAQPSQKFTARQPMISSLRRNLQREHLDRLIDLTLPGTPGAAASPISNLSSQKLKQIKEKLNQLCDGNGKGNLDPYSFAHLDEARTRITKALDAQYIYNTDKIGGGGFPFGLFFGENTKGTNETK